MPIRITGDGAIEFNDGTQQGSAFSTSLLGMRNVIINGNFDIWQRGTSQTASGYFSSDRWSHTHAGSTKTTSRQAFALGQTEVPNNPRFFCRTVVSSVAGADNHVAMSHMVESVTTFSGQKVTYSFWAKADAVKNIAVEFVQNFGSGGTPSARLTGISPQLVQLSTTWRRYSVTADIPNLSGKTIGTDGNDSLQIAFWFDAHSNFNTRTNSLGQQSGTFDIAQVQLEKGTKATDFDFRPLATELQLCQRYYERFRIGGTNGAISASGQVLAFWTNFKVTKRATPSVTLISGTDSQTAFPTGAASYFDAQVEGVGGFKTSNAANTNAHWYQMAEAAIEL